MQSFRYRGARRICLPGQLHVLHPDETHDGAAGDRRRASATGSSTSRPSSSPRRSAVARCRSSPIPSSVRRPSVADLLADVDEPIDELGAAEIAATVADLLAERWRRPEPGAERAVDLHAVELARDYLAAHAGEQTPASPLEQVAGTRPLHARPPLPPGLRHQPRPLPHCSAASRSRGPRSRAGEPLARAAADAGFADQSHLTRQFKRSLRPDAGRLGAAVSSDDSE